MAANVLSGSNQDGPSANACIVAGETFVAPPPFNRDSEGESIVGVVQANVGQKVMFLTPP